MATIHLAFAGLGARGLYTSAFADNEARTCVFCSKLLTCNASTWSVCPSAAESVALDLALTYPSPVRSLTLIGSGLGGHQWTEETVRQMDADELLATGSSNCR